MEELKELYELQKEHIKVLQERIEILKHNIEIDKITIKKFAEYHATTEKKMFKILMLSRDIIIKKENKQFKTLNK